MNYTYEECKGLMSPFWLTGFDSAAHVVGTIILFLFTSLAILASAAFVFYVLYGAYKWAKRQIALAEKQ